MLPTETAKLPTILAHTVLRWRLVDKERDFTQDTEHSAAAPALAPGSIPETAGVPPEDAPPAQRTPIDERDAADDLADGIDLLVRAARKSLRALDPRIEAAAERALTHLQRIDADASATLRERAAADSKKLEALALEVGRELSAIVERIANRVESVVGKR